MSRTGRAFEYSAKARGRLLAEIKPFWKEASWAGWNSNTAAQRKRTYSGWLADLSWELQFVLHNRGNMVYEVILQ